MGSLLPFAGLNSHLCPHPKGLWVPLLSKAVWWYRLICNKTTTVYTPRACSRSWRGVAGSADGGTDIQMKERWGWTEEKWEVMLQLRAEWRIPEWEWSGFWQKDRSWATPPCLREPFPGPCTLNSPLSYTQTIRTKCLEKNRAAGRGVIFIMKLEQHGAQAVLSGIFWAGVCMWILPQKPCPPAGWWAAMHGAVTSLYFC